MSYFAPSLPSEKQCEAGIQILKKQRYIPELAEVVSAGHFPARPQVPRSLKSGRRRQRERNEKVIGLDWQNNNLARESRFFVHFYAVVTRRRREPA